MLLNMYGVKEKDIKDRPECLNVFLNEILEQPKEQWEDRFDKLKIFSAPISNDINGVKTFVVDIQEVKDFIRETLANERMKIRDECYGWANDAYEQAVKEERERILNELVDYLNKLCWSKKDIYFLLKKLKK